MVGRRVSSCESRGLRRKLLLGVILGAVRVGRGVVGRLLLSWKSRHYEISRHGEIAIAPLIPGPDDTRLCGGASDKIVGVTQHPRPDDLVY